MKKGLIATITVAAFVAVAMMFSTAMVQQASAAAAADAPDTIKIYDDVIKKHKKGPVTLSHKKHTADYKVKCTQCHHTYKEGEAVKKCSECHKEKKDGKTIKLEKAYHKNCKDCHKAFNKAQGSKDAPTSCKDCHAKK